IGGMYLNDAFDAAFDRQHRAERPIPSGAITRAEVWSYGIAWLALGIFVFCFFGRTPLLLALILVCFILLYDAVHKAVAFSPLIMAMCRFFLVLLAGSMGAFGLQGMAVWIGVVLAAYIVGLSYVARNESTRGSIKYWPCLLLGAPLLLAWIVNDFSTRLQAFFLGAMLLLWTLRALSSTFWSTEKNVGRTVSTLLAGIVLVDALALAGAPLHIHLFLLGNFGLCLLLQRFVPAT
ncbi:MAG: UbiA family prenyltransferase, partial [Verrucomicrobiota bacterium]|nr:UbiA family prenyltransferase [Verrucomicrobiota bacterium]